MNGIIQIKYLTILRCNPTYTRYHHKAYILSLKQQNKKNNKWQMQKDFKTEQDALVKHWCPRPNIWHRQTDRAKNVCPRIFDSGQLKWRTTQVMIKLFKMKDTQKWRTTSDNKTLSNELWQRGVVDFTRKKNQNRFF
jgi:hypothetical protein